MYIFFFFITTEEQIEVLILNKPTLVTHKRSWVIMKTKKVSVHLKDRIGGQTYDKDTGFASRVFPAACRHPPQHRHARRTKVLKSHT